MNKYEREMDKLFNERTRCAYKCPCGHSIIIRPADEYKICSQCGRKVYKKDLKSVEETSLATRIKRYFERKVNSSEQK